MRPGLDGKVAIVMGGGTNPAAILAERLLKMRCDLSPASVGQPDDEALKRITPLGRIDKARKSPPRCFSRARE